MPQAAPAQVKTEIEKPGNVPVVALAQGEALGNGRSVAGFFVRRRYHGDIFNLATVNEFSAAWMRFVNEPPKEWEAALKKKAEKEDLSLEELQVSGGEIVRDRSGRPSYHFFDTDAANPYPQVAVSRINEQARGDFMDGNGRMIRQQRV